LSHFFAYVSTQFGCTVKAIQCDNGREFDNSSTRTFLLMKGALLRMSCPYTSPQNGKAERIHSFYKQCHLHLAVSGKSSWALLG
jgi:transposase InsO family protein